MANKHYNLKELYSSESLLNKYKRLTVGERCSIWTLIWHELILGFFSIIPGAIGILSRNFIYALLFKGFSHDLFIGSHVTLRCPRQINIDDGVIIDDYVQLIATSSVHNAISIGKNSFIRSFAMLNSGTPDGYIKIGDNCSIGQATILYGNGGLTIGNNVLIAGQCFIVASSHNFNDSNLPISDQGFTAEGITIGNDVWIGAGAKILDGINIGDGVIIGANAVVNCSISPGAKVGGIPARELITKDK